MIALKWSEIYPEEIQSVSIINSSLQQYSPFYHRLLPSKYIQILTAIFESDVLKQEKIILSMTSNKIQETIKYLESFSVFAAENKMLKTNVIRQLILAKNIQINNFPQVILKVINSKNDRLVASECSQQIAKNLNGKIYYHLTAGHDLPLDGPEWLSEILMIHQFDF